MASAARTGGTVKGDAYVSQPNAHDHPVPQTHVRVGFTMSSEMIDVHPSWAMFSLPTLPAASR